MGGEGAGRAPDAGHSAVLGGDPQDRRQNGRAGSEARSGGNHGEEPTRLWGARCRTPPDPALMALSRSPASHWRLIPYDIISSMAHARELERAGLLTVPERGEIGRESRRERVCQ